MGFFPVNLKDGFVSADELSSGTDLSKGQAILGIRKMDKDHDGKLNREEFMNLMDSLGLGKK